MPEPAPAPVPPRWVHACSWSFCHCIFGQIPARPTHATSRPRNLIETRCWYGRLYLVALMPELVDHAQWLSWMNRVITAFTSEQARGFEKEFFSAVHVRESQKLSLLPDLPQHILCPSRVEYISSPAVQARF